MVWTMEPMDERVLFVVVSSRVIYITANPGLNIMVVYLLTWDIIT